MKNPVNANPKMFRQSVADLLNEMRQPLALISLPAGIVLRDLNDIRNRKSTMEEKFEAMCRNLNCIMDQAATTGRRIDQITKMTMLERRMRIARPVHALNSAEQSNPVELDRTPQIEGKGE